MVTSVEGLTGEAGGPLSGLSRTTARTWLTLLPARLGQHLPGTVTSFVPGFVAEPAER
jgi:hypothetical protein